MSRHRDEHLDLCTSHVLGVLDDAGRAELEAHLAAGCEVCQAELRALSGGAIVLALSVAQHRAPAAVRERVLAAVQAEAAAAPRVTGEPPTDGSEARRVITLPDRPRRSVAAWGWAAAAVVLAVSGMFAWQRGEDTARQLAQSRAQSAELQKTLEEERRWAALLESPGTRVVRLAVTPDGDSTLAAQVLFDPASRRAIVVAQRFTLPADRDYELWAITAGGPTSLGVVRADANGRAVVRLENVGGVEAVAAFALSLEASGGSPDHHKPSGPVVMLGRIES